MKKNKNSTIKTEYTGIYQLRWWEKLIARWETHRSRIILQMLADSHGGTVVDLGCGDGELLERLEPFYKKLKGFDISQTRIVQAKKRLISTKLLHLQVWDLDKSIPLPANCAQAVVCEATFGYIKHPPHLLAEVSRILKKNGVVIIQMGNFGFLPYRISAAMGQVPQIARVPLYSPGSFFHAFTYDSLRLLLTQSGFEVVTEDNSGLFRDIKKIWPSLLASDIIIKARKVSS